jgi:predicted metalloprotease
MRWTPRGRDYVDDARGRTGAGVRAGVPLGIGGLVIALLFSWLTGVDFLSLLSPEMTGPSDSYSDTSDPPASTSPQEERLVDFVNVVMADAQSTWRGLLQGRYEDTRAVVFRDAIQSACGFAESATGPFYCPGDRRVYLDLGFFDELDRRFGAPGDFAQAYVLAHEIGHHVQTLLGIEQQVRNAQRGRPGNANALSVRMELQADCFAGIWGHAASRSGRFEAGGVELEPGDVEEGLAAAAAIGDDRLQRMSSGRVAPERFTHGSSEQRATWFRRGLTSGDPDQCDTFGSR